MSLKYHTKPYQEIIALSFVKSVRSIIKGHIALLEYDMTVNSIVIYFWGAILEAVCPASAVFMYAKIYIRSKKAQSKFY